MSTWILLRGLIRQHKHWETFPELMQKAFPDDQVLALDLPGNGDFYQEKSPLSVPDMVLSLREQLKALNIHEPVNVLALSLGAMVAVEWMKQAPHEIKSAVLINTSLRGINKFTERLRPENYTKIIYHLLFSAPITRENFILDTTTNIFQDKNTLSKKWATYAAQNPTSTLNALRQLWAAARFNAPNTTPHSNVLILQGAEDHLVNPICSANIAKQFSWPLLSHPLAGHDLALDASDWIIESIKNWQNK
jgi:pimeloyl-ACP methyl ester carboxylesterase